MTIYFSYNYNQGGYGDFIRSYFAFYVFCKIYNINLELYIPTHPLNKCIKCKTDILNYEIKYFMYGNFHLNLVMEELEKCKNSDYNVIIYSNAYQIVSYDDLNKYRSEFLDLFIYTDVINDKVKNLTKNLEFLHEEGEYTSIHVRCGDMYMECASQCINDDNRLNPKSDVIDEKIKLSINFLEKFELPIFLFTDVQSFKNDISKKYNLKTFDVNIIHLASIAEFESIVETIAEFILLGKSKHIIMLSQTGFAFWAAFLYNKPLYHINYTNLSNPTVERIFQLYYPLTPF